ncbi:hypothetical protein TNCV_995201 [Trichonephila clavipes]|nr:hypothetical protein TNCV_995201 [Trichonephila clavipes]
MVPNMIAKSPAWSPKDASLAVSPRFRQVPIESPLKGFRGTQFENDCLIRSSSPSASFQDLEVCAAIQRDACPDHQASCAIIKDFSDIGGQVDGSCFSPCESTVKIAG